MDKEIARLDELIGKYKSGEISAAELKVHRVPFGVYEQREADTYMLRIRCAAGFISPVQLEGVARIAKEYGIGALHITTRQELQMHYVKLDEVIPIIKRLQAIGLVTRGGGGNTVRNIIAQEDAGIDPEEEFDVSVYARALTVRLISEDDSWNLPRKFKIAFSGSPEDKGYATLTDLGFIARIKDNKKGFKVYVAGGLGAKPEVAKLLFDFIEAQEVYAVAKAVKNIFWKYGNRRNKHAARLRFLWQSLGGEEFKSRFTQEYAAVKKAGFPALEVRDPGQGIIAPDLAPEEPQDWRGFVLWKRRLVKPQKQAGLFSVTLPVELGFIDHERVIKLARFLKPFGEDILRMTREQNFLLRNIPSEYLAGVYHFFKDTLENSNRPVIFGKILSCAGASTCQLGICLSRQAAKAIMHTLAGSGLDLDKLGDIKLNISGCSNSCGQHPAADLGFFGKAARKDGRLYPAYNVVVGAIIHDGQTKLAEPAGEVAAKALPDLVKDFLGLYLSKAARYRSLQEYIVGEGREDLKQLCAHYQQIPGFERDKNYYFDWERDKLFSLSERRSGECSAGLMDLIEVDLGNIKETRKKIAAAEHIEQKNKLLNELVFYSARMLLITRGIEPGSESEVYAAFLEYFVDTGIVADAFRDLIAAAKRRDYTTIAQKENEVCNLSRKVEELYEGMDNAFNFKTASAPSEDTPAVAGPIQSKDLRGVSCPLNFVKTKIELSKLNSGDILEIWLDDGAPIENVPGSVQSEGHEVISQKRIDNYWSVLIRKK